MVAADVVVPLVGEDLTEAGWRDMFGAWFADGVSAGVLNELLVYGDSSGRQVKLKTGRMRLAGDYAENSTEKTLSVSTNISGNPRIDRLVARLDRSANIADPLTPAAIDFYIKAGTPGASPLPPSLTSDAVITERSLARIGQLGNNYTTITAGQVHPERALLSSHSVPTFDDDTARDVWVPSPKTGFTAAQRDTGGLYQYWGGSWKQTLRVHGAVHYSPSGDEQTGTNATWPTGNSVSVDVPAWATRARCFAKISQIWAVTQVCNVDLELLLGNLTCDVLRIRWDGSVATTTNAPQDIVLANDIDCSTIAGTTVTLRTLGNNVGTETGRLRVGAESTAFVDVEFR